MKKIIAKFLLLGAIILPISLAAQTTAALDLDGIDDYIGTPIVENSTTFGQWTLECWVKSPASPNASGFTGPIFGDNMAIVWNHSTTAFQGAASVIAASGTAYAASFGLLYPDTWYHLAATYDGSHLVSYKNGIVVTITTTSGGMQNSTSTLLLGKHPTVGDVFIGTIDEVRVWNVVRTYCQINSTMNSELSGSIPGLIADYSFNDGVPSGVNSGLFTVNDSSSNNNDGTLYSFALTGSTSNFVSSSPLNYLMNGTCETAALKFDGAGSYVNTPIVLSSTAFANWTVECWVKGNAAPVSTSGFNGPIYGINLGIVWNHTNPAYVGSATVTAASGTSYAASFGPLSGNVWYHLAATYDGTNLKSYTNGVLITTTVTSGGLLNSAATLSLGRHPTVSNFFRGTIDEARIWSTARTACQIMNNMNVELTGTQPGLIADYNFDDGEPYGQNTSVTIANDTSSNNNVGTLSSFALTGPLSNFVTSAPFNAIVGSCNPVGLNFDGANDVVNTGIPLTASNFPSWTVECWVKSPASPSTSSGYSGPIFGSNMGIIWNHMSTVYAGSAMFTNTSGVTFAASFGTLLPNTWYHLAATYDGTFLRAFKNGVLANYVTANGALQAGAAPLSLGKHPTLANYFNGTLDEVRIWNVARNCSDINSFIDQEITTPQPGLVAVYNFNDGIPSGNNTAIGSFADNSGNGYTAGYSGFALNGPSSNFVTGATTNVVVTTGPNIASNPVNAAACSGNTVTYSVIATAATGINYQWQVNQGSGFVNLNNAPPYSNVWTPTLTISPAASGMNGYQYRCQTFMNCSAYTYSNAATLTINSGAVITSGPTNQTACPGGSATFNAAVSGATSFQWQFNGTDIPGATANTYTIPTVGSSDNGNYTLTVDGSCGPVISTPGVLAVNLTTLIISQPMTTTVCSGNPLNLSVAGIGTGLTYQWQKDGVDIGGATSANLFINPASLSDSAYYCVIVTGSCGTQTSDTAMIDINPTPTPVVLQVAATLTSSQTGVSYQWYFNGSPIVDDTTQSIAFAANGNYSVEVMGANGCIGTSPVFNVTTTGLAGLSIDSFLFFPNPVNSALTIQSSSTVSKTVVIYDATGKLVKSIRMLGSQSTVDVTDLSNGIYLLQINTGTQITSKRFMKQ